MTNIGTNFHRVGDSFHEQFGVGFGLNFPGGQAAFGPPAGAANAGNGAGFGLGFGDANFRGRFNFLAQQGARRSMGSTSGGATVLTLLFG